MNETNANDNTLRPAGETLQEYRPCLRFFHPNPKGTGGAAKLELHPAHDSADGCVDGSIMLTLANQMTVGDRRGPTPTFPRFDWENSICVKLDFNDLCSILQVLRGECESIAEGHGLLHRTSQALRKIQFRHLVDPVSGYMLEIYSTPTGSSESAHARIMFNPAEALGLCESIAGAMSVISFGIPKVLPHDTAAYRAANRRAGRVAAA